MNIRIISNVTCDDVADVLQYELNENQVIVFNKLSFSIPSDVRHDGSVNKWRADVMHGLMGKMEVTNAGSNFIIGELNVWTVCNMLSHNTFIIKNRPPHEIIYNARVLAEDLGTTLNKLNKSLNAYTDYTTGASWDSNTVTITVTEEVTQKTFAKSMRFPFPLANFEATLIELHEKADEAREEYIRKEMEG